MTNEEYMQQIKDEIYKHGKLAVLFDKEDFVLLKWGSQEFVQKQFEFQRKRYLDAGFNDVADALCYMDLLDDPEEIYKVIHCTGYIERIYRKAMEATIVHVDLSSGPDYTAINGKIIPNVEDKCSKCIGKLDYRTSVPCRYCKHNKFQYWGRDESKMVKDNFREAKESHIEGIPY